MYQHPFLSCGKRGNVCCEPWGKPDGGSVLSLQLFCKSKIKTVFNFLKRGKKERKRSKILKLKQKSHEVGGRSCLFGSTLYPRLLDQCLAHSRPSINMFSERRTPTVLPAPDLWMGAPETGRERAGWQPPQEGLHPAACSLAGTWREALPTKTHTTQEMVNKL